MSEALFEMPALDAHTLAQRARRDAREVCPGPHVLLPNMSYACGGSILTKTGGFMFIGPDNFADIGCPDCAAIGHDELRTEVRRQQGKENGGGGDEA